MKWSWKIARVAGIDVYMHPTFLLLLAWVGIMDFLPRHSVAAAGRGIGFVLVLFVVVVLHELGHALTARRFGIHTLDITLLPIGGVARLERMPDKPLQELVVALAGPAVNVVLALLVLLVLAVGWQFGDLASLGIFGGSFLARLFQVNVVLALFNLLPAFPMDGGRVLRALLALRLDYVRATNIAAAIGQGMAVLLALCGLAANPMLVLIGLFVYLGAGQEARLVRMKAALNGISANQVMITDFRALSPHDPLGRAAQLLVAGSQHDFPVIEDGRLVGLLTRERLVEALAQRGDGVAVQEAMDRHVSAATAAETAEDALNRLRTNDSQTLPVTDGGLLLGLITRENLNEFLMVQTALRRWSSGGRWRARVAESAAS
jgi:Zn-dependent protease/CBS domain-containing protein